MIKCGSWPNFFELSYSSVLQLCLAGHFCRELTLEAPHGFPINISGWNAGWKGSVEVMESAFFLASCLEVVLSSLILALNNVLGVLVWA